MSKEVALNLGGDGKNRYEAYTAAPERLVIVLDKSSVLYDERGDPELFPLSEEMVLNVMNNGVINAVKVRKNGVHDDGLPRYEVVAGRQRVRHAIEANKRLVAAGASPMAIKVDVVTGKDDNQLFELMIHENQHRQKELISFIVAKIMRAQQRGFTPAQIMAMFKIKSAATYEKYVAMSDLHPELIRAADRGVPMSTLLGLGNVEREKQPAALKALEEGGTLRGEAGREAAAEVTAEATGSRPKASGKPKKKAKKALVWKDIEKEKQAILADKSKRSRYWDGVVAGMLLCQGESRRVAFEDAPGGE
jgi:ParB family chromosome partitioning protein